MEFHCIYSYSVRISDWAACSPDRSRSGQPGLSSVWLSQTLDRYAPRCTAARADALPARHRAVLCRPRLHSEFRGPPPPGWRARLEGVALVRSGFPRRSSTSSLRWMRTLVWRGRGWRPHSRPPSPTSARCQVFGCAKRFPSLPPCVLQVFIKTDQPPKSKPKINRLLRHMTLSVRRLYVL